MKLIDGKNNDGIPLGDDEWNDFKKKGFRDSIDSSSNMFSLTSTLGLSSSDNGGNSTVVQSNSTSHEIRKNVDRDDDKNHKKKRSKERMFKGLGQETIDLSEGTHLMINYDWMGTNVGERVGEWIFIEIRSDSIEDEKELISEWKKSLKNTNNIKLVGRISVQLSKRFSWTKGSKRRKQVRKSFASIYTPPDFQQLVRRLDEDPTMSRQSHLERSNPSYEQVEDDLFEENPERYQTQDYQEREEYQDQNDLYIDESLEPRDQNSNPSYQTRSNHVQDYYYIGQGYEEPNHEHFDQEYYYPKYNRGNPSLYSSVRRSPMVLSYSTNRNINSSMSKSSQYSGIRGKDLPYPIIPQRLSGRNSPRIRNISRQQSLVFERQIPTRVHTLSQQYSQQGRSPQYSQYSQYQQPQRQRQQQQYQKYPEPSQQNYDDDTIDDDGSTGSIEKIVQYEQPTQIQQPQQYENNHVDDSHDTETNDDLPQFQDYLYSQKFLSNNYI